MDSSTNLKDIGAAVKTGYPEVADISRDLRSLSKDAGQLGRHVVADGREKINGITETATSYAKDEYAHLRQVSKNKSDQLESYIKERPLQSAAAAVGIGFVLSMLLSRK